MSLAFGRKLLLVGIVIGRALGQTEFEVASVKPAGQPVEPLLSIRPGRLNLTASLRQIIGVAYSMQRFRVLGGPGWLDTELFDIVAKAEDPGTPRDQIRAMLQTLLAERFKLAVHRETKEIDLYSLVVAKSGPRLQEAPEEEKSDTKQSIGQAGFQVTFRKMPVSAGLVNFLANALGRPVVDNTGLKNFYDFKLEYTDPRFQSPADGGATQPIDTAPDIFAALQQQLGLKLEKVKGAGEVLVVDDAERASEN
jgi:uncharacterized protein (TIGR03435 family)